MLQLELQPRIGLGLIKLDASRSQVREVLKDVGLDLSVSRGHQDHFDGIQVEYTDDRTTFIGVSWSKQYKIIFQGTDVFDIPADELFEQLAKEDGAEGLTFNPSEYEFPNLLITLWDADEQYDRIGLESRKVWAQIGIRKKTK